MSEISLAKTFACAAAQRRKVLVYYLTAGFPTEQVSLQVVEMLSRHGADVIELGFPFSDPIADGPVIQRTSQAALSAGMTLPRALELLARARNVTEVPLLPMTYCNLVFSYGAERFAHELKRRGAAGLILADLTLEGSEPFEQACRREGLDLIRFVAPTSREERIRRIARRAQGFLYCISRTGVTGGRLAGDRDLLEFLRRVKEVSSSPVCLGFGVSQPSHVAQLSPYVDGFIVGSALLERLEQEGPSSPKLKNWLKRMRRSADGNLRLH